MHRAIKERSPSVATRPRIAFDVLSRYDGKIVSTVETWDGLIAILPTLRTGEYRVLESGGEWVCDLHVDSWEPCCGFIRSGNKEFCS